MINECEKMAISTGCRIYLLGTLKLPPAHDTNTQSNIYLPRIQWAVRRQRDKWLKREGETSYHNNKQ